MILILFYVLLVNAASTKYPDMKEPNHSLTNALTSDDNCEGRLLSFINFNAQHPECSYDDIPPKRVPGVPLSLSSVVKSYDADYWYPEAGTKSTQEFQIRAARHKCKILQAYAGCSKEFLEEGMQGDFQMLCPRQDTIGGQMFVNLDGEWPNNIARCYLIKDQPKAYEYVTRTRKAYISERVYGAKRLTRLATTADVTHTLARVEVPAREMPDMICFDDAGPSHWFRPEGESGP